LAAALATVRAAGPPIGGVVHAAGTLADGTLAKLDWHHAAAAFPAKVTGALLLDELLADDPLDFFVCTGSMAGTLGNPGQAAYAGANTFLDAFAAWRQARGRPAVTLAFGPWDGDGMAGRLDDRLRARLEQHGVRLLPPALAAEVLVQQSAAGPSVAVLPIDWTVWLRGYATGVPPLLTTLGPRAPTAAAAAPTARLDVMALPAHERRPALRAAVRTHVATVLGFADSMQIDADRTFRDLGLDSLLAVDAKDRLERVLGRTLPATLLFDHPDLDRLTDHLLALVAPTPSTPAPADDLDDLDALSTDTLAARLAAELRAGGGA
jgi:acyl carrier protein